MQVSAVSARAGCHLPETAESLKLAKQCSNSDSGAVQVIGGSAAKRYGGKRVLTVAVLLWSFSTIIVPLCSHSIYALIFSRVLLGLGEGVGK